MYGTDWAAFSLDYEPIKDFIRLLKHLRICKSFVNNKKSCLCNTLREKKEI